MRWTIRRHDHANRAGLPRMRPRARIPYRHPQPKEAFRRSSSSRTRMPDGRAALGAAAENVWFRPLCLSAIRGYWMNLLRVRKSGVLSRHRHPQPVHGFVLKGEWHYLEHDWTATEGAYVYEAPGETHTLVVERHVAGDDHALPGQRRDDLCRPRRRACSATRTSSPRSTCAASTMRAGRARRRPMSTSSSAEGGTPCSFWASITSPPITADARGNHAFYTEALGMRLVKKTVNQDDVSRLSPVLRRRPGLARLRPHLLRLAGRARAARHACHRPAPACASPGRRAFDYWAARLAEHGVRHGADRRARRPRDARLRGSGRPAPQSSSTMAGRARPIPGTRAPCRRSIRSAASVRSPSACPTSPAPTSC